MVAKDDTWEYDGTIFKKCPKCEKGIPAEWMKHDKCGWESPYAKLDKQEGSAKESAPQKEFKQTAVGNNIKSDVEIFEKALCDAVDISSKIETAKKVKFDAEQIQKIGTTLFLRRVGY
jgi:hypothetical protein